MRRSLLVPAAVAALALAVASLEAQNPTPLAVGTVAPEFVLTG